MANDKIAKQKGSRKKAATDENSAANTGENFAADAVKSSAASVFDKSANIAQNSAANSTTSASHARDKISKNRAAGENSCDECDCEAKNSASGYDDSASSASSTNFAAYSSAQGASNAQNSAIGSTTNSMADSLTNSISNPAKSPSSEDHFSCSHEHSDSSAIHSHLHDEDLTTHPYDQEENLAAYLHEYGANYAAYSHEHDENSAISSHEHDKHCHDHKPHSHRAIIGFDEHGIPKVLVPAEASPHTHKDAHGNLFEHFHEAEFTADYMKALLEYKKTFPTKQEVLEKTPDPAVREMMLRMEQIGVDTAFDRFDKQMPMCSYGLSGVCCKICNMGPCKITKKADRGTCGADADLIVSRNLLRQVAAGVAQHGAHARELLLSLKWAAQGKLDLPIIGEYKIINTAKAFGIPTEGRELKEVAIELADTLLTDLSQSSGEYKTITALAPKERQEVWRKLDILPISAYNEVFEAYHRTGVGTDGDWRSVMQHLLRCGLAFTFTGVVAANIATDALFGVGDRVTSKSNMGALKKGWVNIAVHGHLPTLVSLIVEIGNSKEYQDKARAIGAQGIAFYGVCCSGLSAMYRNWGVVPLSNAVTAELVIGTGALDLWVADVQDVYPAIMDVANCFQTKVVTTSSSARLPGAEHIGYDHHHSNIAETRNLARKILDRALQSHEKRKGLPVYIPPYEVEAEVGFSVEFVHKHYGGMEPLAHALKSGEILGIVNMVGCTNPKVPYERAIIDVAQTLIENNVLILTNGCASFPLMKLGFCQKSAYKKAGASLRAFLEKDELPPVWHVGECIDNTRSSGIFAGIAGVLGKNLYELPLAFTSPEWANEKGVDASLGFRLMGIDSYHCVEYQIHGSANVIHFFKEGTRGALGSVMHVDTDPVALALKMASDMRLKRKSLGWQ